MTRKTMKKMMATTLTMVMIGSTALGSTAVFAADGASEKVEGAEGLNIGATYYTLQTEFCMRMDNAAQKWAEENGVKYKSYDGNNDAATQLSQVETMIADGVDAIILNPQDADACSACVDAADEAGIPIVGVNTMVNNDKLTAYVGSQDVSAGEDIMKYMIDYMKKNAFNIVVIEGPMGQSAQLQRMEGIENVLKELNIEKVDGIYLDLGVSSYQLDTASRGFTYREDAPLDMRMDQRNPTTAADIVNGYSEMELFHIIRDYGEDNFAKNIAKHIVKARAEKPIETTGELSEIIKAAIPAKVRATGGHPAKRTFQAIRIELNHELDVLENSIDTMIRLLNPEGRLSIITFHSLEDRIVKTRFRTNENPCICPPDFPVCVCGRKSMGKVITRKPILPSKEELEENSRSKSAKLRVFERAGKEE